jgi:hypothetical protein
VSVVHAWDGAGETMARRSFAHGVSAATLTMRVPGARCRLGDARAAWMIISVVDLVGEALLAGLCAVRIAPAPVQVRVRASSLT